jgi:hypothetical protein
MFKGVDICSPDPYRLDRCYFNINFIARREWQRVGLVGQSDNADTLIQFLLLPFCCTPRHLGIRLSQICSNISTVHMMSNRIDLDHNINRTDFNKNHFETTIKRVDLSIALNQTVKSNL